MIDIEWIQQLMEWQKGKDSRSLDIAITHNRDGGYQVWAFDFDLFVGEHVRKPNLPKLEAAKEERERAELAKLKAKYEGQAQCQP